MEKYMMLIVMNVMVFTMFILSYYLNKTSNNGIFFGVRIPKIHNEEVELKSLEKEYKRIIIIIFVIIFIISNSILGFNIKASEEELSAILTFTIISSILIHTTIFIVYYKRTIKLKKKNQWNKKTKNIVIVDTTLRKPKKIEKNKPISEKYFLILLVFPIIMAILTSYKYGQISELVNVSGREVVEVNKETLKGFFVIFQFPIEQLFMIIMFYFIVKFSLNSKSDLNSGTIKEVVKRKKKFKRLISIMMIVTAIEIMVLFTINQFQIIFNVDLLDTQLGLNILILITMILFIIKFIKVGQGGRNLEEKDEIDELYRDDDDKWILGVFYYNKNDPSFMVEKRVGIGYTINFANTKAVLIFLVITLVFIFLISTLENIK
ncbi:DUF1648 domain-containing protein [Clostridium carnis]